MVEVARLQGSPGAASQQQAASAAQRSHGFRSQCLWMDQPQLNNRVTKITATETASSTAVFHSHTSQCRFRGAFHVGQLLMKTGCIAGFTPLRPAFTPRRISTPTERARAGEPDPRSQE
eukprot:4368987-Amphidinium_carterae.2